MIICISILSPSFRVYADLSDEPSRKEVATAHIETSGKSIPFKAVDNVSFGAATIILISFLVISSFGFFLLKNKKRLVRFGVMPLEQGEHISLIDTRRLSKEVIIYLVSIDGAKHLIVVSGTSVAVNRLS